jgi:hypothetical protein
LKDIPRFRRFSVRGVFGSFPWDRALFLITAVPSILIFEGRV